MINILLCSDNIDFADDLQKQIIRFIPGSSFMSELPDLIIIDNDLTVYAEKRKKYPSVPVIFMGNGAGINQDNLNITIPKPFSLMKLFDILKAANHKLDNSAEGFLSFNGYELHPNKREIIDLMNN